VSYLTLSPLPFQRQDLGLLALITTLVLQKTEDCTPPERTVGRLPGKVYLATP
jgi:hypothetical protein